MNAFVKPVALALFVVSFIAPAIADTQGIADKGRSIRLIGDGKFFLGDCEGKTVALLGNRQTISLTGTCRSIVSHGSGKHITFDAAASLQIDGDNNSVTWRTKPVSVKALGHGNSLTNL